MGAAARFFVFPTTERAKKRKKEQKVDQKRCFGWLVIGMVLILAVSAPFLISSAKASPPLPNDIVGNTPWVTILCQFGQVEAQDREAIPFFEGLLGDSYPGVGHYFLVASSGKVNLAGSVIRGPYAVGSSETYSVSGLVDLHQAGEDCIQAADEDVFFPDYYGINLFFDEQVSVLPISGGREKLVLDGVGRIYGVTWITSWGMRQQAVIAHEMGHGFGLGHTESPYGLMGNLWSSCSPHPEYGCVASRPIVHSLEVLGWFTAEHVRTLIPGEKLTINLSRFGGPGQTQMLRLVDGKSSSHYTVEVYGGGEYTSHLPNQVLVHYIDSSQNTPTVQLVAELEAGREFFQSKDDVWVQVISQTAFGFVIKAGNSIPKPPLTKLYLPLLTR